MTATLNKAILIGNLGRDPEIRHTTAGKCIATLSIATMDQWRDKVSGERKERTEWHRVTIFVDALAKLCGEYLKKGSKVYIEGALQTRKYTDKNGEEKYTTEVIVSPFGCKLIMLDNLRGDRRKMENNDAHPPGDQMNDPLPPIEDDSEIPF